MSVYEQITFFHKKSKFLKICFPDRKIDFLKGGPIFGTKFIFGWGGGGPRSAAPGWRPITITNIGWKRKKKHKQK